MVTGVEGTFKSDCGTNDAREVERRCNVKDISLCLTALSS